MFQESVSKGEAYVQFRDFVYIVIERILFFTNNFRLHPTLHSDCIMKPSNSYRPLKTTP